MWQRWRRSIKEKKRKFSTVVSSDSYAFPNAIFTSYTSQCHHAFLSTLLYRTGREPDAWQWCCCQRSSGLRNRIPASTRPHYTLECGAAKTMVLTVEMIESKRNGIAEMPSSDGQRVHRRKGGRSIGMGQEKHALDTHQRHCMKRWRASSLESRALL